jgi:hypothetical protein
MKKVLLSIKDVIRILMLTIYHVVDEEADSSNWVSSIPIAREIFSRTFSQIDSSEDESIGGTIGKKL